MADNVTNEMLLEQMQRMQANISSIRTRQDTIGEDLRSVKGHMGLFLQTEIRKDTTLADLEARIDRIERKLDLMDL
ncbi:hypothetical protein E4191_16485 (plasmid) [Paracoccus liaowanqingii]|uniref:Uncharacterized protein n=1 Tax=Paracoccus liaowanqingii TaxID=2560053 RepID=A0A4Y5SQH3_9RHOB|nr:hypothetical protein [Paracoccus liaowanqingii]QDA35762.1 hypothetical protein E4191_16485 [Paracoccus liaowanqingii]